MDDGKIYRKPLYLVKKHGFRLRFSLKPIHWIMILAIYNPAGSSHSGGFPTPRPAGAPLRPILHLQTRAEPGAGGDVGKWEFTSQKGGLHGINPWKWGCHGSLSMTNGEWSDWSIEIYETRLWLNHQTCRTWWFLLPEINQHRGIKSQQNFEFLSESTLDGYFQNMIVYPLVMSK